MVEKQKDVSLRKILHEPIAPYFASTYNTLMSVVLGVSIGMLFSVLFWKVSNFSTIILVKAIVSGLFIGLVWHRYVTHTQHIVWRLGMFDTVIPMGFAGLQLYMISMIQQNAFKFSMSVFFISVWGFFAYLNAHLKHNNANSQALFEQYFREEGKEFSFDFFWENSNFQKIALFSVLATSILFGVICAIIYLSDWSEETETYLACAVFIVVGIILFSCFDFRWVLNRSKKESLKNISW